MNNYLKVQNAENLVRDMTTGAVINTDTSGYESYIAQRNRVKSQKEQILQQEKDINNIKNELYDIKELLLSLIEKNGFKG